MRPNEPPEECDEPEYRPMCCSAENTVCQRITTFNVRRGVKANTIFI